MYASDAFTVIANVVTASSLYPFDVKADVFERFRLSWPTASPRLLSSPVLIKSSLSRFSCTICGRRRHACGKNSCVRAYVWYNFAQHTYTSVRCVGTEGHRGLGGICGSL